MIHPDIYALHAGTWQGQCSHCGAQLTVAHINSQDVILAGNLTDGFVACHARHVVEVYKNHVEGEPVPELVRRFASLLADRMKKGGDNATH